MHQSVVDAQVDGDQHENRLRLRVHVHVDCSNRQEVCIEIASILKCKTESAGTTSSTLSR